MKIIMSFFLLCVAVASQAQEVKKVKARPQVFHSIGGSFQDFEGLNSRVAKLPEYKTLRDNGGTLGLGWIADCNRLITSGSLTLGSTMSGDKHKRSSTVRNYGITADIGYDVVKSERVMLYPFAGLGYNRYQAIFNKDVSTVSFDDVLQSNVVKNSISAVKFNNSFAVYRLGVGFLISSPKRPSHSIGIQAGYAGSFKNSAWRSSEDQTLGNAPEDKISQFFVGLVFSGRPMGMK